MFRVGVAGGSGYGGGELLHILLRHPEVELVWVSSQQHNGKVIPDIYPNLRSVLDMAFSSLDTLPDTELDVLFLALPPGEAMKLVPQLPSELMMIDLSGDFRIADPAVFERFYGFRCSCPQLQKDFVYGLTELNREKIRLAHRIANPGCFATATLLALYPLYQKGWIRGPVFVDAKTGSSGAGRNPLAGTHHSLRNNSLFPYKPFAHQHLPEITQFLEQPEQALVFQTYSTPLVRGIFSSHYLEVNREITPEHVCTLYEQYYNSEYFVRWVPQCPDVNFVRHSNFVDIGAVTQERFLIVWSTLDNLQKGAAGQAIQNMNVMCGLPEETALSLPSPHP